MKRFQDLTNTNYKTKKQRIYTAGALSGCTLQHGHNQRLQLITYMINKRLIASYGWLFKMGYLNVHTTYIINCKNNRPMLKNPNTEKIHFFYLLGIFVCRVLSNKYKYKGFYMIFNVCFQSLLKMVYIFQKKIMNMHTIYCTILVHFI